VFLLISITAYTAILAHSVFRHFLREKLKLSTLAEFYNISLEHTLSLELNFLIPRLRGLLVSIDYPAFGPQFDFLCIPELSSIKPWQRCLFLLNKSSLGFMLNLNLGAA
jgi:hypothetical protein